MSSEVKLNYKLLLKAFISFSGNKALCVFKLSFIQTFLRVTLLSMHYKPSTV